MVTMVMSLWSNATSEKCNLQLFPTVLTFSIRFLKTHLDVLVKPCSLVTFGEGVRGWQMPNILQTWKGILLDKALGVTSAELQRWQGTFTKIKVIIHWLIAMCIQSKRENCLEDIFLQTYLFVYLPSYSFSAPEPRMSQTILCRRKADIQGATRGNQVMGGRCLNHFIWG